MVKTRQINSISNYSGKTVVYIVFKGIYDNIDNGIKNHFKEILDIGDFTGKHGEFSIFYANSRRYVVLSLGEKDKLTSEKIRRAFGTLGSKLRDIKVYSVAVDLTVITEKNQLEAAIEGLILGNYRFTVFKSVQKNEIIALEEVNFISSSSEFPSALVYAQATVEGVLLVRELGNSPSNIVTPTRLAEECGKLAGPDIAVKILEKEDIIKERMGLFEGVFKGSAHADPPKFIILEYKPQLYTKTLVLVGKAITFDSGGISIKGGEGMGDMKFDMLGGAAVIGAFKALSLIKPQNIRVIGLIPSTPNIPDAFAYRPGDILTSRTGKTVEVINTDAEGRMLLADALGYAQDYKPDLVFDFATLTGGILVGLGIVNAGFYLNEQSENLHIKDLIFNSGRNTGDYVWHMPLDQDYFEQIKSDYADIKQTGGRFGSSISAAMFLKQFTNYPWIHFDIVGPAWTKPGTNKLTPYNAQTGATGFGVRLIMDFIRNWDTN